MTHAELPDDPELLRALARLAFEDPSPVLRIGADGTLQLANTAGAALCEAWGRSEGDAVPEVVQEAVARVLEGGRRAEIEVEAGARRYALTLVPVAGAAYVHAYGRDVTLLRLERARTEILARFPRENPNPVLRASAEGRIEYANDAAAPLLAHWNTAVGGELPADLRQMVRGIVGTRGHRERVVDLGDRLFAVAVAGVHEALYVYLYGRDISERRRAEEAEHANRTKSTFLANMSHELRTPLNAILGYAELVHEEVEDFGAEDLRGDLERIQRAARHLLGLIDDILDLSKIEAGRMEVHPEFFELGSFLDDIAATMRPLVEEKGNTFRLEVDLPHGAMYGDVTKVRQILFNLIGNASKFTSDGEVALVVRGSSDGRGDVVSFEIRDTGIGMTADQLARLFRPFTQADASTTRKYGGTGLGLTISKLMCKLMKGDIEVTSERGVGSVFAVTLPRILGQRVAGQRARPGEAATARARGGGDTVLAVDDDPQILDLLERFLAKEGFDVRTASGADEALELARQIRPAVITLDVMMPGVDGWEVLRRLKDDPDLAGIPVVMLTIVDDRNLGYALGASDYLTKPFDRQHLVRVLQRYRAEQQDRVLVVDDEPDVRDLLGRILRKEGWQVDEARDGHEALERIAARPPDLILLDLMMPEMDGLQVVEALRSNPTWRRIPVIVLTAKELTAHDRERLFGAVLSVVSKTPAGPDGWLQQVRDLIVDGLSVGRP